MAVKKTQKKKMKYTGQPLSLTLVPYSLEEEASSVIAPPKFVAIYRNINETYWGTGCGDTANEAVMNAQDTNGYFEDMHGDQVAVFKVSF